MAKLKTATLPTIKPEDITLIFPDDKPYAWRREGDITIDPDDKENPFARFYDERVLLPVPIEAVKNTLTVGIVDPVVLFEFQGKILVDAGNQRVKRRRLANALAEQAGEPIGNVPFTVPYQLKRSDDLELLSIVAVSTNRFRQDDDYAANARNARRMMERNNWTKDQVAEHFGVSRTAVTQWFDFLGMAPEIIKAVEKGKKVSATTVLNWRKMSHEEQADLLTKELATLDAVAATTPNAKPKKLTGTVAKKAAEKVGVSFTADISPEKLYAKAFAAVLKLDLPERLRLFRCFDATGDEVAIITAEDLAEIDAENEAELDDAPKKKRSSKTKEVKTFEVEVEGADVKDLDIVYDDAVKVEAHDAQPTVIRRKRAAK